MIELQPSASLGTLRVVVFGRGDRECREWVKPPREPHAIQTVRSCNRYVTCLTCSSSLSGSSLPISRFSRSPRPYPSHPHAPILPISTANPITFDHRLAGGWGWRLRLAVEPWKSSLKIGSMRDEVRLPEEFDRLDA